MAHKREAPDADTLFRRKTPGDIRSRYSDALRRWTEKQLDVRLPGSYIALLRQRNGGKLRLNTFRIPVQKEMYTFDRIAGLDRSHADSITHLAVLAREWEVPEGLVPLDGDGHWWLCLDYRRCGPDGEPAVTHYETESRRGKDHDEFRVADSFAELLAGLVFDPGDFVFAIDDPRLLGESLHKQLVALGCKGTHPPDAGRKERKQVPHMWTWPDYKADSREPASLFVYENGVVDPWSPARPAKHPLLMLHVGRNDQERCVRRLAEALAVAVPLIHQPADRPVIRGLPEAPPSRPAKPSPPAAKAQPKLDPKDLNAAVQAGDRTLVKALLASGAEPDKRYFGAGSATALDCAVIDGETAMLKLLLEYTRQPLSPRLLTTAVYNDHLPIVKLLTEHGLSPNEDHLTDAVTQRHVAVVQFLLSLGVKPSPKAIRRAAGFVEPSLAGVPRGLHNPILRMLKAAGAEPPDAKVQKVFDTL